jgi:hypothetical protein
MSYTTITFTLQDFKFNMPDYLLHDRHIIDTYRYHISSQNSKYPEKEYYYGNTLRDCNNNLHISYPIPETITKNMIFNLFNDNYGRDGHETYGILYKTTYNFRKFQDFMYRLPFNDHYVTRIISYMTELQDREIKKIALKECKKYMCNDVVNIISSYI